ncbi:MAG: dihydrofolate reductase [Chitinophagaceae bacterium]|nr:dihydrofolate reductase [Chitinophagaceae bacterium]
MKKIIVSEWISLDGVFDASLMGEWNAPYHSDSRADYIKDSILSCGAMLYGRKTYEMLAPYWSALKNNEMGVADKLNNAPKYVVSSTLRTADWGDSTIVRGEIAGEIKKLKKSSGGDILVQGSATLVRSLLDAGLVDELRLLVHPIIMGKGERFFRDGMHTGLQLTRTLTLDMGVMALYYQPV